MGSLGVGGSFNCCSTLGMGSDADGIGGTIVTNRLLSGGEGDIKACGDGKPGGNMGGGIS